MVLHTLFIALGVGLLADMCNGAEHRKRTQRAIENSFGFVFGVNLSPGTAQVSTREEIKKKTSALVFIPVLLGLNLSRCLLKAELNIKNKTKGPLFNGPLV